MKKGQFPIKKTSGRKKLDSQVPSSPDTIEDEDLLIECSKGKIRSIYKKRIFFPFLHSYETTSDRENTELELNEVPNSDIGSEMSKMLQMFESDINKTLLAKKRKIENFTNAAMDINQNKLMKVWKNQNISRKYLIEEYRTNVNKILKQWETDMTHQKEQERKVIRILQQHVKVIDQTRAVHMERILSFHKIHDTLTKSIENLKTKDKEQMESMKEEMRQEMLLLQNRTLMENQQQEMLSMRKSLQHIFLPGPY